MKKLTKWSLVGALVIGFGIFGYYQLIPQQNDELAGPDMPNGPRNKKVLSVSAKILEPHLLTDEILAVGRIVPDEEVHLSFETSGKITAIYFSEGTYVSKGTLLAKVNDSQLQAQLARLQAQVPLAEERVYRQSTLLQRDAVSREALEIVKTELAALNADIEKIQAQIEMTELRAPFDGIIGLRQVSLGAYASPTTVIAKLTSMTPIKIEFSVAERYATDIKKGANHEFRVNGNLNTFKAQVYATESSLEAQTRSLLVRARYANKEGELMPGQYADIRLKQKEIANAIAIPAEAIVPEMGKNKVFVFRSGKAEPVDVVTGIRTESEVQILDGLQEGDTILTSGTLQLRKGLDVKIAAFE